VVFDALSNATAYTVTCTATQLRCGSLTIAGPASGNVTWAGTAPLAIHGNVTLPATGLTRTYTGAITLSSSSTGLTFTTNGVTLASEITVNGVSCSWSLGSALTNSSALFLVNGSYNTAGFTVSGGSNGVYISFHSENSITLSLGASSYTVNNSNPILATPNKFIKNLTFNVGTSTFILSGNAQSGFNIGTTSGIASPITFYNFDVGTALASSGSGGTFFGGGATFNNLRFFGRNTSGSSQISIPANVTVNGTLTVVAGTDATCREVIASNTLGTTRTITAAAVSLTDVDFRDITIAGAAAPAGGTRIGDCKGNSGITFTAAANKYWNLAAGGNWGGAIAWATGSGGSPAINNFPLAQDTTFIENTGLNASATITINAAYNIGTLNMSSRTTAMTLATSAAPTVYGNWVNGTGVTPSGTNQITFAGRTSQTLTNAGRTFTQGITVDSPSGTLTLQDAFVTNRTATGALTVTNGTFDAATYNVTLSGAAATFSSSNSNTRTIAVGSGTWTLAGSGTAWDAATSTGLTVTGTGTITLTSASAKTFAGGGAAYTNITVNQGGAGALTITGNNTLKDITNTYKGTGATSIALGATTQRVSHWTGAGEAARILTLTGTSAASPATLILTGATKPNVNHLSIANVRAYSLDTTWYAGANSTNNGSLGWYFESSSNTFIAVILETASGTDTVSSNPGFRGEITETGTGTDSTSSTVTSGSVTGDVLEAVTGSDVISARVIFGSSVAESGTATDAVSALSIFVANINETGSASDVVAALREYLAQILETATGTDAATTALTFLSSLSDTATATDTTEASNAYSASTSETATATEVINAALAYLSTVAETATASEVISALADLTATILESGTASDETSVAPSTFNAPVEETATISDFAPTNIIGYASITETVTINDVVVARFLWEPVIDTQTPNWQTITNIQTSGWTLIPNTQTSGWVPVQTTQEP